MSNSLYPLRAEIDQIAADARFEIPKIRQRISRKLFVRASGLGLGAPRLTS